MKKISVVALSIVMVGSTLMLPSTRYTSSYVGISTAEAARGARASRGGSRGSVSRSAARGPRGGATRTTVRTPRGTASRTTVARPVPVRRPPPPRGGYHHGNHYNGGAVLAAGIAGLAIGAMVASIPPSCTTIFRNGIEYRQCGDTYYQQSFNGPDVVYVVVAAP